jgi:hypothetical protein
VLTGATSVVRGAYGNAGHSVNASELAIAGKRVTTGKDVELALVRRKSRVGNRSARACLRRQPWSAEEARKARVRADGEVARNAEQLESRPDLELGADAPDHLVRELAGAEVAAEISRAVPLCHCLQAGLADRPSGTLRLLACM